MATDFEYDWCQYDDGSIGLLFTPPQVTAFLDVGLQGDGHDWARLLERFLPRVAPAALEGTEFDPESDMFVAINRNPLALQQMVIVIEGLLADESALKAVITGTRDDDGPAPRLM